MAAQFAHLIYADQHIVEERLAALGASHITNLNRNDRPWQNVVAYGFVLDGHAWIVFRGSDDLNDWAANLLFVPFRHFGFGIAYRVVQQAVLEFAALVGAEVDGFTLTGHSLGGGLATLATQDLARAGHPITALTTFGAPRVGSPLFARRFNRQAANREGQTLYDVTCHYSTAGEWVSRTPFVILGFCHVGKCHRFPSEIGGGVKLLDSRWAVAIREASFDTVVPFALPLFLPFFVVFSLDRFAYHNKAAYVRHFAHAKPLVSFGAPSAFDKKARRKTAHPLAKAFVLLWGLFALALIAVLFWYSFKVMAMPWRDTLAMIAMVIFVQVLGRWQNSSGP